VPAPVATLVNNGPDIYVAGASYSHSGKHYMATYWKNGTPTLLTDTLTNSGAISIIVDGNDVYVAGYTFSSYFPVPTYWKNGVKTTFGYNASISGMCLQGSDIYISGSTVSPHGFGYASYWKDGALTNVTDGTSESTTSGITVNGNDIYLSGSTPDANGFTQAAYWKNGVATILAPTTYSSNGYSGSLLSEAYSIFTQGADVYVTGFVEPQKGPREACYWKNGVQTKLSDTTSNSEANAIYVQGTNTYIAGYTTSTPIGYTVATYWKNGIQTKIDSAYNSTASGIAVNGNDIYIAGTTLLGNGATYWKNGVPVHLKGDKGTYSKYATGITIVPQQ